MVYRVGRSATGAMGTAVLRGVIDHPATELAGVFVYGEEKAGLDAGAIARRPDTGVIATRSVEDTLALDVDVVVHASRLGPYGSHDDEIIALLESGKNVISINGYSHPRYWAGLRADALAAAGERGGATIVSAGLNPGFLGEQLAVVASGLTMYLDSIEIVENVDSSAVRQPEYPFGTSGFGAEPATVDPDDVNWGPVAALNGMFEEAVGSVSGRLGLPLDAVETDHRAYAAEKDLDQRVRRQHAPRSGGSSAVAGEPCRPSGCDDLRGSARAPLGHHENDQRAVRGGSVGDQRDSAGVRCARGSTRRTDRDAVPWRLRAGAGRPTVRLKRRPLEST